MPTHRFGQQTELPPSCLHISATHPPLAQTQLRARRLLLHLVQVHCSYSPLLHDTCIHFLNHHFLHLLLKLSFNAVLSFTCQGYPLSFTAIPASVLLPKICLLPHLIFNSYHASNTFLTTHSLVTISKSKPNLLSICQQDSSISVRTSAWLSKDAALSTSDTAAQGQPMQLAELSRALPSVYKYYCNSGTYKHF